MAGLAQAVMWHRQAAALALAADRVGVGTQTLPPIRARIAAQRASLQAAGAGADLAPSPTEIAAAMPALGDLSAGAVAAALGAVSTTLDAADAALHAVPAATVPTPPVPAAQRPPPATPPPSPGPPAHVPYVSSQPGGPGRPVSAPTTGAGPPAAPAGVAGWRPGLRNALVYGGYSFTVLVVQLVLLATVDEVRALPLLGPVCLGVLPAFAWAAGWLTIGVAFRPAAGARAVVRTPRLGVLVCLLPNIVLCVGLGVLFLAR